MSNTYVEAFRQSITDFYNKQKGFLAEIENIKNTYKDDVVQQYLDTVTKKQSEAYMKAVNEIINYFEFIKERLAYASYPSNSWITADKEMWFDKDYDLEPLFVIAKVEEYRRKGNFPMLAVIKWWIDKRNQPTSDYPMGKYVEALRLIITPEDALNAYKQFAEGALSLLDTIYNGIDTTTQTHIDSYADANFAKALYAVIDGISIAQYRADGIPEVYKHKFDDVKVSFTVINTQFTDRYLNRTA